MSALKILEKKPQFMKTFQQLGESWEVDAKTLAGCEEFVCHLYGFPRSKHVNDIRPLKLKSMCGKKEKITSTWNIDLYKMAPCLRSLTPHANRANYQLRRIKLSHVNNPDIPDPTDGHGWTMQHGVIEPLWTEGDILPSQLVDILRNSAVDDSDSEADRSDNNHASDSEADSDWDDDDL